MTDEHLTNEVRRRVWQRFWTDVFATKFYQHLGRRFEEIVDTAETMGHEQFSRATAYTRKNWTLIKWVEENLEGANGAFLALSHASSSLPLIPCLWPQRTTSLRGLMTLGIATLLGLVDCGSLVFRFVST